MFEPSVFTSPEVWLGALYVFALRVVDMSLDTLRVLYVLRGRKLISWVLGFFQSLVFVIAITSVLTHLDNVLMMLGYAAGFATGNVIGIWLEEKLAIGHTHIRLISPRLGHAISARLREEGFALTEVSGMGKDGAVTLINCNVLRKHVKRVLDIAQGIDPEVFVTSEDVRPLQRGYWRA